MYNSENYTNDYNVELHIRAELEPLLSAYKVDLFLAGHYHSYERTCKVLEEKCYDDNMSSDQGSTGINCTTLMLGISLVIFHDWLLGTVHITIGSAGASLDVANWMDMNWRVFGDYEFGSCSADSLILLAPKYFYYYFDIFITMHLSIRLPSCKLPR